MHRSDLTLAVGAHRRARLATIVLSYCMVLSAVIATHAAPAVALQGPNAARGESPAAEIEIRTSQSSFAGWPRRLIVQVINSGSLLSRDVVVRQQVPDGARFVSASDDGFLDGANAVRWPAIPELAAGEVVSYEVLLDNASTTMSGNRGKLEETNLGRTTSEHNGPESVLGPEPGRRSFDDAVNEQGRAAASANPASALAVQLADVAIRVIGPATAASGDTIEYLIEVRNVGPNPAEHVTTTDLLPIQATFLSADGGGTELNGVVTWPQIPVLRAGQTVTYRVRVLAPACGLLITNQASASARLPADPDLSNNTGGASTTILGGCAVPDVEILKTAPLVARSIDTITYTIIAANRSSLDALGVVVTDTLPARLQFIDATAGWTLAGMVLSWPAIPRLSPGDSVVYFVTAAPLQAGTFDNVATVAANTDTDPTNNVSRARTIVLPGTAPAGADIAVTKSGPAVVAGGDTIRYDILVQNLGPDSAHSIMVRDTLPAGTTFVVATSGATISGSEVMWTIPSLGPGGTALFAIRVLAPAGPAVLINIVRGMAATPTDPDTTNNRSEVVTQVGTVEPLADVVVEKFGPSSASAGDTITYQIFVFNNGPAAAFGVEVADTLPMNSTLVDMAPTGSLNGRILTWPAIAQLIPGDTMGYTVRVLAPGAGACGSIVENAATARSASPADPDPANNASRVQTVLAGVCGDPDIALEKDTATSFTSGGEGTYRFTVRNVGSVATTGPITVTDELPAGLLFVSGSGAGWVVMGAGRDVMAEYSGVLQPGEEVWFEVVVSMGLVAAGQVCNTAVAATPGDEGDDPNNVSTVCFDAGDSELGLEKTTATPVVSRGGLVDYRLRVTVAGSVRLIGVEVTDRLPVGFRYIAGTTRVNGAVAADPAGSGRDLTWDIGDLDPGAEVILTYKARVGPGTPLGPAINHARARDGADRVSNPDSAAVEVRGGDLSDEGIIAGRVFLDSIVAGAVAGEGCICDANGDGLQDAPEPGIPGVVVYLQDGTSVITDGGGRFVFHGLSPRTWVVRVDAASLPAGAILTRTTNRHSDDGAVLWVDLKRGELHRADFAVVGGGPTVNSEVERRASVAASGIDEVREFEAGSPQGPPSIGLATRTFTSITGDPFGASFDRWIRTADADSMARAPDASAAASGSDSTPGRSIAIGFLEARLDRRTASSGNLTAGRDRFEDELSSMATESDDGRTQAGARAALFYRGRLGADYGVTLRLDSEKDESARLFRDIRPDELYPVWGDASIRDFGAVSRNRFYGRVGRDGTHLTYGDFNSGQRAYGQSSPRVLGEYARTLTGAFHQLDTERAAFSAFASRERSSQVVDVLAGAGVSGPYELSRSDVLINSERVELVTRDRNQPSVIRDVVLMERYVDYTIEPLTGRLIFKRPIPSVDEDFHPIEIRVSYEVESATDRFWVYGLAGQARPARFLEIGGSAVRDDDPAGRFDLFSANATVAVGTTTTLSGEIARTDSAGSVEGDAMRLELRHAAGRVAGRIFWLDSDASFANRSAAIGRGREEVGALARARIDTATSLFAEALSTKDEQSGRAVRGGRVGIDRMLTGWLRGQLAYRRAEESGRSADSLDVNAIGLRLTAPVPGSSRARLFGEFEQDVSESDRRRAEIGMDVRLFAGIRLYGRHELLRSLASPYLPTDGRGRNATVIGLSGGGLSGETLFSEYRIAEGVTGREAHAAIGLRNRWQVGNGTRISTAFERLSPVGGPGHTSTAAAVAGEFTGSDAWKGSARLELRSADGDENLFGSLGYARRLSADLMFLGNSVVSGLLDGGRAFERTRLGIAYRESARDRWNALARYEHRYERATEGLAANASREAHLISAHADVKPSASVLLRGQWVSKFATEKSDGLETSENAHLLGARTTVDLTSWLDAGAIGRTLFTGDAGRTFGLGAEIGLVLVNNLRIAAGYNVFGFRDREFSADEQTDRGPYLQIGYKFDEGLFRRGAGSSQNDSVCRCPGAPPPPDPELPPDDPIDLDVTVRAPNRAISTDTVRLLISTRNVGGGTATSSTTRSWVVRMGTDGRRTADTVHVVRRGPLEPGGMRVDTVIIELGTHVGQITRRDSIDIEFETTTPNPDPDPGNDRGRFRIEVWPADCNENLPAECAPNPLPVITGPNRVIEDTIRIGVVWRNVRHGPIRLGRRFIRVPPGTIPIEPPDTSARTTEEREIELNGGDPSDTLPAGGSHRNDILLRITNTIHLTRIAVRHSPDTLQTGGDTAVVPGDTTRTSVFPDITIDPHIVPFPRTIAEVCTGRFGPIDGRCHVRLAVDIETRGGVEGEIVPVTVVTHNAGHVPARRLAVGARIDDRRLWTEIGDEAVSEGRDWLFSDTIAPNGTHRVTVFIRCPAEDVPFRAHATAAGVTIGATQADVSVPCRPRPGRRPPPPPDEIADISVSITPVRVDGYAVRFQVTTSNAGPAVAQGVRTSVSWPTTVAYWRSIGGEAGPGVLDWREATLGTNESISYMVELVMPRTNGLIEVEASAGTNSSQSSTDNDRASSTVLVQQVIIQDTVRRTDTIFVPPDTLIRRIEQFDTTITRFNRTIERFDTVIDSSGIGGTVIIRAVDRTILRWLLILSTLLILSLIVFVISEIIRRWRVIPAIAGPAVLPAPTPAEPEKAMPLPLIGGTVTTKKRARDIEHVRGIVEIDGVRGTGFLVERDRWVTVAHIVQKRGVGGGVTIRFGADRNVHGTIEALDTHTDLAVIKLGAAIDDIEPLEFATSIPVSPALVSFGFREHGAETWTESDGVLSEVHARDRLGLDTMVILATSLTQRLERANDLAGAPVLEAGRIVGVIRGRVPHPDSIERQFTRLLYSTSAARALELLGRPRPAQDPAKKGIPVRPDDCCEGDERYAFVCYVGADEDFARRLANRLEGGGFRLFLGRQEMAGRSRLSPEEKNALDNSRFGLILFSRHWHARSEHLEEAAALFRRAERDSSFRLLTLRLDGTPLPPNYEVLETIDFCGSRPDQGDAIRALTRTMFAVKDETHEMVREEFDRATDDVIREMIDAVDAPKRVRAMAHRWRELRMAGVEPDLCAIDLLLDAGRPDFALEVYERIPAWVRSAVRTRQLHARILLDLDRPEDAAPVLDALGADGHLDAAMGLHLGAVLLQRWNESGRRSHAHLRKAFEMYRTCYHRTSDVYAGLHAAVLARFLDETEEASAIATEILEAASGVERPTAHEAAGFGGAALIAGRTEEAFDWFEHAVAQDPDAADDIAGMQRVVRFVLETAKLEIATKQAMEARVARIFHVPSVAAFAGPQVVADEMEEAAQSEERETRIRQRIRARLDALDAGHGVCSAGDRHALLFAEEILERGGRVDLVLPYGMEAFVYAGVPASEVDRFERIAANAQVRIHELEHVPALDRESAHRNSEARVRELARRRAESRNGKASVLAMRDDEPAAAEPTAPAATAATGVAESSMTEATRAERTRDLNRRRRTEAPAGPATYRKVHALVVGIDAYEHWPHLSNASRDAQGVAESLEQRFGAHVRRLDNADGTAKRIEEVIKNVLRREVEADDLVIFYFAGHGHTERLGNDVEHGFLVPVDARDDNVADLMSLQDVSAWTEYLQCRHVLYIVDSCFSGFAGQAGGVTRRGGAREARIAIAAGTAEQTVFDGGAEGGWSDHSVFTGYLLRGLEADLASSERPIDETMLIGYLRENVMRATRGKQTPVYGFLPGHGSDYIRLIPRETR